MLFLIDYDRQAGRIVKMDTFQDSERAHAQSARLELELDLHGKGISHEVVLLQAVDLKTIQKTHRRYFATLAELAQIPDGNGQQLK